jgi:type IV secretory pathway VirB6-like protein
LFKNINYQQLLKFLKYCFLCFILLLTISCNDSGCIDADDFGEYENQLLTVYAGSSENKCKYDIFKQINDLKSQGPGMLTCLSSGSFPISDKTYTGCGSIPVYADKMSCFNSCYEKCQQDSIANSISFEPPWIATSSLGSGETPSITLYPDSEIYIQAKGNISLGQDLKVDPLTLNPKSYKFDNVNLNKYYFDFMENTPITLNFWGTWIDKADIAPDSPIDSTIGPGNNVLSVPAIGIADNNTDKAIYNGIKRIFVYSIPHPQNYILDKTCKGDFPASTPTEDSCTLGAPLLADPRVWICSIPTGTDVTTATCGNSTSAANNYKTIYTKSNLSFQDINSMYPVSNSTINAKLGYIGGFIRANDDLVIKKTSYDPFSANSVTCDSSANCANYGNVNNYTDGKILGTLSGGATINNNLPYAKRVYFRLLSNAVTSSCNTTLVITQKDKRSKEYNTQINITVSSTWSNNFIDLEANSSIEIANNYASSSNGINCGSFIAMKFLKYSDIEIKQSGFVKFTNIGAVANSGNCNLKARVINGMAIDRDFYEYETFQTSLSDPLRDLVVPASPLPTAMSWSGEVFLRKGQKIRISPETWNQSISVPGGTAECGVGMAMTITPRPALLCRGTGYEIANKPNCIVDISAENKELGCKPHSLSCEDPSLSSYCPASSKCQFKMLTCVNGSLTTPKTGCTASTTETIGTCTYNTDITKTKCSSCSPFLVTATQEVPQYKVNGVDLCYDLENYNGSVESIPLALTDNKITEDLTKKGLKFLEGFNGIYGSLAPFVDAYTTIDNNKVYQSRNLVILRENSRLIFGFLDGVNFTQTKTSSENNLNTSSGMKVAIGTTLSFSNGQWLEAMLCSNQTGFCTAPESTQLPVVSNSTPANNNERSAPNYSMGKYKFDNDGLLYRFSAADPTKDCKLNGIVTEIGSKFYCHTYETRTASDLRSMTSAQINTRKLNIEKLRLAFKIKDPEERNCYSNKPAVTGTQPYNGIDPPYDGTKIPNTNWDKVSSSESDYCDTKSYANGATCTKKLICINTYANNTGKYDVSVKIKSNTNNNISKIIGNIIEPVSKIIDGYKSGDTVVVGEAERLYRSIIGNNVYKLITKLAIVMMCMFYGLGYLMGVSELSQSELMNRVIKIAIIYLFTGETGFEWFKFIVIQLFRDGVDFLVFSMVSNFDDSADLKTAISNGDYSNKALIFGGVDKVLNIFFSDPIGKKMASFLFSGFFGWAYILILYYSIFKYIYAIATALLIFLTAKFFISILFVAGPILILFSLFKQTEDIFDKWLKYMISFSLQQVMVASTLAFFNILLYEAIKLVFNFKICWEEIWVIKLPLLRVSLISFWTISNTPKSSIVQAGGYSESAAQYVPSLFSILFIWLIASLMKKMITYLETLAAQIGGGLSSSTLGSGIQQAATQLKNATKDFAKQYGGRAMKMSGLDKIPARIDSALFNSGSIAKAARQDKREQMTQNKLTTNEMKKSGDTAINDYKNNNATSLAKMTNEKRDETLREVRNEAMKDKGKELGLSESKIDKVMNKGDSFKTTSDNALMIAAKFASHNAHGNKAGLNNNKINADLSVDNLKNAAKDMNSGEKKDFISDLKNNQSNSDNEKKNIDKFEKSTNDKK